MLPSIPILSHSPSPGSEDGAGLGIASPFPGYVRRDAMTIKLPD